MYTKQRLAVLTAVVLLLLGLTPAFTVAADAQFAQIDKAPNNQFYTPILLNGHDGVVFAFNDPDGLTQFRVYGSIGKTKGFFPVTVTANELPEAEEGQPEPEQTFTVELADTNPVRDGQRQVGAPKITTGAAELPDGWENARTRGLVYIENLFGQKEYRAYASFDGENYGYYPTKNSKPAPGALATVVEDMNARKLEEGGKAIRIPKELRNGFQTLVIIRLAEGKEYAALTNYPVLDAEKIREETAKKGAVSTELKKPTQTKAPAPTKEPAPTEKPEPKITTETEQKAAPIPFETELRGNPEMLTTDAPKVAQEGKNGVVTVTYTVTYTDGVETKREVVKEEITKVPVKEIVEFGTKIASSTTTKTETKTEPIPFTTERRANADMLTTDTEKVVQAGVNGVRTIVYLITLKDGEEIGRIEQSNAVTTSMVPQIVEFGTKTPPKTEVRTEVKVETIPFETVKHETDAYPINTEHVAREGENGEKQVTYTIKTVDGVEVSREVTKEEVTKEAVAKVIHVGTSTVTYEMEYEYVSLSGGGVAGPHSSYYEGRARAHAMAMAKAAKVYHSGNAGFSESVGGFFSPDGIASALVNHAPAFKDPTTHYGFGCVRARQVASNGNVSAWYYYACLQGGSPPDP